MAAICQSLRFLKLPNPNAKCVPSCRAAGAGPPPWNSANLVVQACSTRYKLVTRLLKVRTVTFSSDSSRKWTSVWLVGENLDRSWQAASSCWWMLGSVSEHQSHSKATISKLRGYYLLLFYFSPYYTHYNLLFHIIFSIISIISLTYFGLLFPIISNSWFGLLFLLFQLYYFNYFYRYILYSLLLLKLYYFSYIYWKVLYHLLLFVCII